MQQKQRDPISKCSIAAEDAVEGKGAHMGSTFAALPSGAKEVRVPAEPLAYNSTLLAVNFFPRQPRFAHFLLMTEPLKNLVLGRWPLQIGSSQCAASYPCQVRIVFLYLLSFWTHYQQLHGMRNAARGMVFGRKSTGANWLTAAPLVERFCHFTAFTTPSPRVRSYREAAVAT